MINKKSPKQQKSRKYVKLQMQILKINLLIQKLLLTKKVRTFWLFLAYRLQICLNDILLSWFLKFIVEKTPEESDETFCTVESPKQKDEEEPGTAIEPELDLEAEFDDDTLAINPIIVNDINTDTVEEKAEDLVDEVETFDKEEEEIIDTTNQDTENTKEDDKPNEFETLDDNLEDAGEKGADIEKMEEFEGENDLNTEEDANNENGKIFNLRIRTS